MARPNKQGVDYFPLDVHLDDKFKFIEIKYKLEGFAVVIKLLQKIYSYGYWYKWTEDESYLFADEIRTNPDLVQKVVEECIKRDIFDAQLYERHSILTSSGIQKRFKEIVRRRKDVEVISDYLLIDGIFGVNDDINTSSSKQNNVKSTQIKVNKTDIKEENIKQTEQQPPKQVVGQSYNPLSDPAFACLTQFYSSNIGELKPAIGEQLDEILTEYKDVDLILEILKRSLTSADYNKLNWTRSALRNLKNKNVVTLNLLKLEDERKSKQGHLKNGNSNGSYLQPSAVTLERSKREAEEWERKVAAGEIDLEKLEVMANEIF